MIWRAGIAACKMRKWGKCPRCPKWETECRGGKICPGGNICSRRLQPEPEVVSGHSVVMVINVASRFDMRCDLRVRQRGAATGSCEWCDVYRVTTASVTDWRTAERIASCCNRAECRTFALPGHMVPRNSPSPSSAPVSIPNPNNCNSNPRHQSHKCNNHDNTFWYWVILNVSLPVSWLSW